MGPWIGDIRHPSLVLTGEHDGGCNPRLNARIAASMPNAELVILPGLRHAILLESPQAVAPPVLDFLRRQGLNRTG
jgi:pimeloyl-ACP methyl ester carboxylesterase